MTLRAARYCLLLSLLLMACTDEVTVFEDPLQSDVILETDVSRLENSISYTASGVLSIYEEPGEGSTGKEADPLAGEYPLTLVAQVRPPSYQGSNNLTASHVALSGNYAYVSYNVPGEAYFGALEIIDIANPNSPRVTSRLYYLNADINSIRYDTGYVYIAGGVNAETSVTATSNSFVARIAVNGNRFDIDAGIQYGFQPGYNANDLLIDGARVLVTSGKEGSLSVYNKADLSLLEERLFPDLRSLALYKDRLAVLDAGTGIRVLDGSYSEVGKISITTDFGSATKKIIDFRDEHLLVSEGALGMGVYSFSNGSLLQYIPILSHPEGVSGSDLVTNAVASNEGTLLMANGGAGLCLSEAAGNGYDIYGIIELEGSINYVASRDDYIFAASGKEGLQIIKFNRPSEGLSTRCSELPQYAGSAKLIMQSGEVAAYSGSKRFNTLHVGGSLLLCGSWTVQNAASVSENALFEYMGTLVIGRNNRRRDLRVAAGATLRIEGNLTVFGDLILEDHAVLEFVGSHAEAAIYGKVVQGDGVHISGSFEDLQNAF